MASKSINIENTLLSIKTGIIPGYFSSDFKIFVFPTIRYTNERKDLLEWSIELKLKKNDKYVSIDEKMLDYPSFKLDEFYIAEITINSQQVGGKIRKVVPTIVTTGKNIGKKNETNVLTQAFRDALSLYNKHMKKTSVGSSDEKPPPMLIQWLNDSKSAILTSDDFKEGITVQRKYNGVRYVTFMNINKNIVQYSRTGSDYYPAEYLTHELVTILSKLPELSIGKYGIKTQEELEVYQYSMPYLDGELYLHGRSLSYISGQARKESDKGELNYHVFDVFFPYAISEGYNMISKYRQQYLDDICNKKKLMYVKRVENFRVNSLDELNTLSESFIKDGYEGAIARRDNKEYKYSFNNYHSSNVLKIKPIYSNEFKVVGFTEGKKGKDVGKIIWLCEVENPKDPNDSIFTVVPNLPLQEREALFNCLSQMVNKKQSRFDRDIKGLPLTLEYSEISQKTGKPLQAKAIAFRTYESGIDPIKKVFKDCGII